MGQALNKKYILMMLSVLFTLFSTVIPVKANNEFNDISEIKAKDKKSIYEKVYLDADSITYNESTSTAVADGNVKVKNKDLMLSAPYAEYNSDTNIVDAYSDQIQEIIVSNSSGDKFIGKHLKYNIETGRGIMTQVHGQTGFIYLNGGDVKFMPADEAAKLGIIKASKQKKDSKQNNEVAQWTKVTATTCNLPNPHYRLVAKKVIVNPNGKTVLKQPKVYIGKTLIFISPFDYVIGKKRDGLIPIIRYNSDKGAGIGISGPIDIGNLGELSIGTLYWTKGIWEAKFDYKYNFNDNIYAFANVSRTYNSDTNQAFWGPSLGINYTNNGWHAKLRYSERELIKNEIEPDVTVDYNVSRKPEFLLSTPWFEDKVAKGKFRLFGIIGQYCDNFSVDWTKRYVLGGEYQAEPEWKIFNLFKPRYGVRYTYYDYPDEHIAQKVAYAWAGVSYNLGSFSLSSTFAKRWVNGDQSPMFWDRYYDSKVFTQSISVKLPIGSQHEEWTLGISGNYDFNKSKISSMLYSMTYNMHCITWQLWYHDKISNDERRAGVSFYINAFPEHKITLGSELEDEKVEDNF